MESGIFKKKSEEFQGEWLFAYQKFILQIFLDIEATQTLMFCKEKFLKVKASLRDVMRQHALSKFRHCPWNKSLTLLSVSDTKHQKNF